MKLNVRMYIHLHTHIYLHLYNMCIYVYIHNNIHGSTHTSCKFLAKNSKNGHHQYYYMSWLLALGSLFTYSYT